MCLKLKLNKTYKKNNNISKYFIHKINNFYLEVSKKLKSSIEFLFYYITYIIDNNSYAIDYINYVIDYISYAIDYTGEQYFINFLLHWIF